MYVRQLKFFRCSNFKLQSPTYGMQNIERVHTHKDVSNGPKSFEKMVKDMSE